MTPKPQEPWRSPSGLIGYLEGGVLYLRDNSPARLARENRQRVEAQTK